MVLEEATWEQVVGDWGKAAFPGAVVVCNLTHFFTNSRRERAVEDKEAAG